MILNLLSNLSFYIPEVLTIFLMCTLMIFETAYKSNESGRSYIHITAGLGLIAIFVSLVSNLSVEPLQIFSSSIVIDPFSTLIKMVMVLGTLGIVWLGKTSNDIYSELKSEFLILCLGVLLGGMLLVSANNLLTLYIGIEILSILSYVLASLKKNDSSSSEAGLKYVLYGGLTAGIMLFGMSHIYGMTGTIQFNELVVKMKEVDGSNFWILMTSFLMFFAGLGYKISCFPFHMWSPDVYQGAPIPVTSFFAIVPKLAGIGAILRVSILFFDDSSMLTKSWIGLLHIIAALTMTVGNVTAIGQDSVKRLLAFSSIGHVGMMLLGVVVVNEVGTRAVLFYGITYLFMTLVAFYITAYIADKYGTDSQVGFKGLISKHPFMAIAMTITLFSLAGLPPLSGFVAKFNILSVVVEKKYYGLAFIAAINSVIALYYYMKLVKVMIFGKVQADGDVEGFGFLNQLIICGLCVPVVTIGIFWDQIMKISGGAKIFIQ